MHETYTVITGASSGIGRAAARQFASRGSSLILTARHADQLASLAEELRRQHSQIRTFVVPADLSRPGEAERIYEATRAYPVSTWINNAGRGFYGTVSEQNPADLQAMLELDVLSVAALSSLYVRDYRDAPGAQLINVSSCGGYLNVPQAVSYCGAKFFVSAFTEGLALELLEARAELRAKVFAPAATKTEFGSRANRDPDYDYSKAFRQFHTADEAASLLMELYDSNAVVGLVDRESFAFELTGPRFPYAGGSLANQQRAI
ncbi:MAG: SDR family NAD(P)-dependent oxidoreductase [Clostridia bacterium]|nr:SDR family NAD(P)-dependent oxidoreductase [Clostridia bacterium]